MNFHFSAAHALWLDLKNHWWKFLASAYMYVCCLWQYIHKSLILFFYRSITFFWELRRKNPTCCYNLLLQLSLLLPLDICIIPNIRHLKKGKNSIVAIHASPLATRKWRSGNIHFCFIQHLSWFANLNILKEYPNSDLTLSMFSTFREIWQQKLLKCAFSTEQHELTNRNMYWKRSYISCYPYMSWAKKKKQRKFSFAMLEKSLSVYFYPSHSLSRSHHIAVGASWM